MELQWQRPRKRLIKWRKIVGPWLVQRDVARRKEEGEAGAEE